MTKSICKESWLKIESSFMTSIIKFIIIYLLYFSFGNAQLIHSKPYNADDYPNQYYDYSDTTIKYSNLKILIKLITIKNKYKLNKEIKKDYHDPCFWIDIYKEGKSLSSLSFFNVNAVGGYAGLSLPNIKLPDKYLFITKHGDYDGRIILIKRDGQFFNLPGGQFIFTENEKYIINFHESDGGYRINIFDLAKEKQIYNSKDTNLFVGYPIDCYANNTNIYINTNPGFDEYFASKIIVFDFENGKTKVTNFDDEVLKHKKLKTVPMRRLLQ